MRKFLTVIFLIFTVVITTGAGYVGTLPDIEAEFSYLRKEASEKAQAPYSVEELDKQNESQLKPVPLNNSDYVDIIIKKDKTSQYANDISSVLLILEKLRRCLNTDGDIQKFNAIVSNFIDNVEYIRIEYKDKPESSYISYNRLLVLSAEARDVATYRMNGLAMEKYLPYTAKGNIYTKEALNSRLEKLLANVNDTIYTLKNLE
ncbi:hypothetical protein II906_08730 [bacterium]|nr:hypothetical protein [bacterium]